MADSSKAKVRLAAKMTYEAEARCFDSTCRSSRVESRVESSQAMAADSSKAKVRLAAKMNA